MDSVNNDAISAVDAISAMNNKKMQITVICVTFNSQRLINGLVNLLKSWPNVIFVDNASSDQTVSTIKRELPSAQVIESEKNEGFGRANNMALALVKTPFALLLNPDCTFHDADIMRLMECAGRFESAALVVPQAWLPDGNPQAGYGPGFMAWRPMAYRPPDAVVSASWLIGCCILFRMSAYHDKGLKFDPKFFLYYEDDDLSLQARVLGYECLLEPAAAVQHLGSGSSSASMWLPFIKALSSPTLKNNYHPKIYGD